jgi:hypothetical protein
MRLFLTLGITSLLFLAACNTSPEEKPETEPEVEEELVEETIPTPSPSIDLTQAGNAANGWANLIENGCDTSKIWTPIEARILRNTPFAMRGYDFVSFDLKSFFLVDGASYYEGHTRNIILPKDAQSCVDSLAKHEGELLQEMPITDEQLARFTTPDVFEALQFWGEMYDENPYTNAKITDENGYLRFESLYGECVGVDDCGGYMIDCFPGEACLPNAAG